MDITHIREIWVNINKLHDFLAQQVSCKATEEEAILYKDIRELTIPLSLQLGLSVVFESFEAVILSE